MSEPILSVINIIYKGGVQIELESTQEAGEILKKYLEATNATPKTKFGIPVVLANPKTRNSVYICDPETHLHTIICEVVGVSIELIGEKRH